MAGPIRIALAMTGAQQATAHLRGVENSVGRVGARFTKLRLPAAAVAAGFVAVGGALLKLAKGAAEDEKAQAILAKTLKNTTGATDAQVKSVEDYISRMGRATGVTDDEMRPALATLARATGDVGKAQGLMGLAMDVSAGTGKDLGAVSLALAKAQKGNVSGLAKLGIATKDASGKTKSFAAIQADLAKMFAGQAATAAETTAGKYARVRLQLSEAGETIGAKLIPVLLVMATIFLTKLVPALEQTIGFAERNKTTLGILAGVIGGLAGTILLINGAMTAWAGVMKIVTAATKIWTAVQLVLNFVLTANPIGLIIVGIALLVAGIILAYKHSDKFRAVVDAAFKAIKAAVLSVITFFTTLGPAIFRAVGNVQKTLGNKGRDLIIGLAKGTYSAVTGWFRFWYTLGSAVVRAVGAAGRYLIQKGRDFIGGLMSGARSSFVANVRFFTSIGSTVVRWVGNALGWLRQKGHDLINGMTGGASSSLSGLGRLLGGLGGRVGRWVGNLGGALVSAGRDIIRGLINGVNDMIGSLQSTLSHITSMIPDLKGPLTKDRKLLTPNGRAIIESLIRGMDDEKRRLQRYLAGVSGTIEGGLSASPSVTLAGSGVFGRAATAAPIVINVYAPMDGPEIGRRTYDALRDYVKINGPIRGITA